MVKKQRVKISDGVAAKVLFSSNRTCCVCKLSTHVQIHHIDDDPSNNNYSNLAVLCSNCHSVVHAKHDLVRNLTPELITLYSDSWKKIVKTRLDPGGSEGLELEYRQQVLLELSLIPHSWKNQYMALYPGHFQGIDYSSERDSGDVWDMMLKVATHEYSIEQWNRYKPLFDSIISNIINRLEQALMAYGDVIPVQIKLAILRANSSLNTERIVYLSLPDISKFTNSEDAMFSMRFSEVIRTLSHLSRLADSERELIS